MKITKDILDLMDRERWLMEAEDMCFPGGRIPQSAEWYALEPGGFWIRKRLPGAA